MNTFNMTDYYQGLFVQLLLGRLQRAGKYAMHKRISQRFLVVIDEAQHFLKRAGDSISEFVIECRKFGITLILATQSPKNIPDNVYGQIYSTIAFHLNRADAQVLVEAAPALAEANSGSAGVPSTATASAEPTWIAVEAAPALAEAKSVIQRPPIKRTLGIAVVQAMGYPYPAVIRVPRFERRIEEPVKIEVKQ